MTYEQRGDKLSSIITALLYEQQSPIFFPLCGISNNLWWYCYQRKLIVPFPFQDPPIPPLCSPHSPLPRFFPPNHSRWLVFTHCVWTDNLSYSKPRLSSSARFQIPPHEWPEASPYLLLISPITDANSLCLVVWARVLTDFPVVSLPEPQSGSVFSRAAVASPKSRHTRLPFSSVAV